MNGEISSQAALGGEQVAPEPRPELLTYEEVAKRISYSLTRPEMTEEQLHTGLALAKSYQLDAVIVRPCDVDVAVRMLEGSGVRVATVCGFPHGSTTTAAKLYEGRDLLRRGAKEVGIVANFGKMFARQFQHVESEILQLRESCTQNDALCKVIFETGFLPEDLKIILTKISKRCEVQVAETSTCFGPRGYSLEDLALLRRIAKGKLEVQASGGLRTLSALQEAYQAGADRFSTSTPGVILDEWKAILAARKKAELEAQAAAAGTSGPASPTVEPPPKVL